VFISLLGLGLLGCRRLGSGARLILALRSTGRLSLGRSPEGLWNMSVNNREREKRFTHEIVAEELHDESRVLVALLAKGVKLCDLEVNFCPSQPSSLGCC
jgi:hypothetical protein